MNEREFHRVILGLQEPWEVKEVQVDAAQQKVAQELIGEMGNKGVLGGFFNREIVTEVLPLHNYWPAEDYHQDFFERNPGQGYCVAVAGPKVAKFRKTFSQFVKG